MKSKKSQGLTLNTIVLAVLVLILLVVMIFLIWKYVVKGPSDTLSPIEIAAKKNACCTTYCLGSQLDDNCKKIIAADPADPVKGCNCMLSSPTGNGEPAK